MSEVVELAKALIACPSVTPRTVGVFNVLEDYLRPLGFTAQRMVFKEEGFEPVENIYLRLGTGSPNFCFAGHTDVVPPGDEAQWSVPPFEPRVEGAELIGRGAEDMKGAIAAFMVAVKQFVAQPFAGSISFLITQDEEGDAVNGTRKMLGWLKEQGEVIDHCIVGEPTNPDYLGEMVKIGRRGSISFRLTVKGKQGHAAYPERADNPITRLVNMLHALKSTKLDDGTEHFPPSNLEITSVDVGNPTSNIIPASASARFNVRFNNLHSSQSIAEWVRARCAPFGEPEMLSYHVTGEAFLNKDAWFEQLMVGAVQEVTGHTPKLSTTGGTSDARYIKDVCPVIEFGTTGRTAHMIDERVEVTTLEGLAKVYEAVLRRYFA
jgi:succinyl-diaminopimelate desuccinylase